MSEAFCFLAEQGDVTGILRKTNKGNRMDRKALHKMYGAQPAGPTFEVFSLSISELAKKTSSVIVRILQAVISASCITL